MWQGLYQELKDRNFMVIAIALDSCGADAVRQWIRATEPTPPPMLELMGWGERERAAASAPTYPCLIDEKHVVAELYNIVNVPMAVWIDERGHIVRPAESAGACDAFRKLNLADFSIPPDAAAQAKAARTSYFDAIRDWVINGGKSAYALPDNEARGRVAGLSEQDARANTLFRLGQYLFAQGHREDALKYLGEARRLRPDSWAIARQSWEIEEAGKASGPDFWAAVQALGDRPYYPPAKL